MKKKVVRILLPLFLFAFILMFACRPSSPDDRRQSEVQDSIRLEEERRELIERANRMLESREAENGQDDAETDDASEQ
jgi:hypothetical protein